MTRADLSVCICVRERKSTSGSTVLIVFLATRLLQASQCECVCEQGKQCVRLYLESLQTPSSPLPSSLSARRICQFSFSAFVPALILLSKPWLALLTAAEHRSYSFFPLITHIQARRDDVCSHTLALATLFTPPLPSAHSRIGNDRLCYRLAHSGICQSLSCSHSGVFAVTLRSHCEQLK